MSARDNFSKSFRPGGALPYSDRRLNRSDPMSWLLAAAAHLARAVRISGRKATSQEFSYG